ncbi:MAG: hypothetical protein HY863_06225 [Chloroflexi bacterium]|nr:hypothetical protein [Chloroflexota bacterium]
MKTLGRILIILMVFAALSALMVVGVNASGVSASSFRGEGGEFRPGGEGFPPGFQPGADGNRVRPEGFEEHSERGEGRGGISGLMFGAVRNIFVIALLVTLIVWPRSVARKKRKMDAVKPAITEG